MDIIDEGSAEYLKIMAYIDAHPAAVVATVNADGTPQSAVVFVVVASHHTICFMTRNLTQKYQNIYDRPAVSVTIFDQHDNSTLQASGQAFVSTDEHMLSYVKEKIEKLQLMRADSLPPIEKLRQAGDYALIGIELQKVRLIQYQGVGIDIGPSAFTEIPSATKSQT